MTTGTCEQCGRRAPVQTAWYGGDDGAEETRCAWCAGDAWRPGYFEDEGDMEVAE